VTALKGVGFLIGKAPITTLQASNAIIAGVVAQVWIGISLTNGTAPGFRKGWTTGAARRTQLCCDAQAVALLIALSQLRAVAAAIAVTVGITDFIAAGQAVVANIGTTIEVFDGLVEGVHLLRATRKISTTPHALLEATSLIAVGQTRAVSFTVIAAVLRNKPSVTPLHAGILRGAAHVVVQG